MTSKPPAVETQAVRERYARRELAGLADLYSPLRSDVMHTLQERQRVMLQLLVKHGLTDLAQLHATDVGCGTGDTLLELLRLGFAPQHLHGLELLPARFEQAHRVLPASVRLLLGDATQAQVPRASQDLVLQNTVFSSLLDNSFQEQLAHTMWRWLKPGGAVLWYDFTVNNPRNADVRGVPLARVQQLFPQARITARRVTLAPPLARALCRVHPQLHPVFNSLPLLRTHVLAWLAKPL